MALPTRGQSDWDDELAGHVGGLEASAASAVAAAEQARSNATQAIALAQEARARVTDISGLTGEDAAVALLVEDEGSAVTGALSATYVPQAGDVVKAGAFRFDDAVPEVQGAAGSTVTYLPGGSSDAAWQVGLSGPGRIFHLTLADDTVTGGLIGLGVDHGSASYPYGLMVNNKAQSRGIVLENTTAVTDANSFGLYGRQNSTAAPLVSLQQLAVGSAPALALHSITGATSIQKLLRVSGQPGGVYTEWGNISGFDGSITWSAPLHLSSSIRSSSAAAGDLLFRASLTADGTSVANYRVKITANGAITWSDGAGLAGPSLSRQGTTLWTPSVFRFDTGLRWGVSGLIQTTVGAAGAASALPATPSKYLKVQDDLGVTYVIPAYAAA